MLNTVSTPSHSGSLPPMKKHCEIAIDSVKKKTASWDDIFEIYHICVKKWVKERADFPWGGDGAERLLQWGVWGSLRSEKVDFKVIMRLIITPDLRLTQQSELYWAAVWYLSCMDRSRLRRVTEVFHAITPSDPTPPHHTHTPIQASDCLFIGRLFTPCGI